MPAGLESRHDVCSCIDELARVHRGSVRDDEEWTESPVLQRLVAVGAPALPAIAYVVTRTEDAGLRSLLLEAAGRMGDPSALPMLEALLGSSLEGVRRAALDAIARIGGDRSLAVLRRWRDRSRDREEIDVLAAMCRCGDQGPLAELLRIGLADATRRGEAIEALLQHVPLRQALGFPPAFQEGAWVDGELFLPAADEWYRETVLGQRSPWRPVPGEALQPPFLAVKLAALDYVTARIEAGNGPASVLRVRAVDPFVTAADLLRGFVLVTGIGHGQGLRIEAWQSVGTEAECLRLTMRNVAPRSAFPGDDVGVACLRVTMPRHRYEELVVGLRTVLAAELVPWWSGPDRVVTWSSHDFVVGIDDLGGLDAPVAFCGYEASEARQLFERLLAAARWHDDFVVRHGVVGDIDTTLAARRRFSAAFTRLQPQWDTNWWWVRERMLGMARSLGDASLVGSLLPYVAPEFAEGGCVKERTAAAAINALAAITGTDLRCHADGTARSVHDAAREYHRRSWR